MPCLREGPETLICRAYPVEQLGRWSRQTPASPASVWASGPRQKTPTISWPYAALVGGILDTLLPRGYRLQGSAYAGRDDGFPGADLRPDAPQVWDSGDRIA